jgi:hypothetical protein
MGNLLLFFTGKGVDILLGKNTACFQERILGNDRGIDGLRG